MAIDKEELRKLSPEERIKRLKQLEEEGKKEIEEASDLIKRTEAEIAREKEIPDIEVPKIEPVDISKLFGTPGGLETTVRQEAPIKEEETLIKYNANMPYTAEIESPYMPDEEEFARIDLNFRVEDSVKYESASQKAEELTGSRSVLKSIKKYTMG